MSDDDENSSAPEGSEGSDGESGSEGEGSRESSGSGGSDGEGSDGEGSSSGSGEGEDSGEGSDDSSGDSDDSSGDDNAVPEFVPSAFSKILSDLKNINWDLDGATAQVDAIENKFGKKQRVAFGGSLGEEEKMQLLDDIDRELNKSQGSLQTA